MESNPEIKPHNEETLNITVCDLMKRFEAVLMTIPEFNADAAKRFLHGWPFVEVGFTLMGTYYRITRYHQQPSPIGYYINIGYQDNACEKMHINKRDNQKDSRDMSAYQDLDMSYFHDWGNISYRVAGAVTARNSREAVQAAEEMLKELSSSPSDT